MSISNLNLPVGIDDFKELREGDNTFVDKSLFIREFLADQSKIILLTRPRRFGKTLNMSMLYYFLTNENKEENKKLFDGLKITECGPEVWEHQGKYPVIFLTLKGVATSNFEGAMALMSTVIRRLFAQHRYLLESDALAEDEKAMINDFLFRRADNYTMQAALVTLSEFLKTHHGVNPIILIDEYDKPIHASFVADEPYHKEMILFMQGFLGEALKTNVALSKAALTGILRISQANMFSGLNNLSVYTIFDREYTEYFGFTEEEVENLLELAGAHDRLTEFQRWYNGYQFVDQTMSNPWSTMKFIQMNFQLMPYWLETGENSLIGKFLKRGNFEVKEKMRQLMEGREITVPLNYRTVLDDVERDSNTIWTLLTFAGYLNAKPVDQEPSDEVECKLSVPNLEVLGVYRQYVKLWMRDAVGVDNYNKFLNNLTDGNIEGFKEGLAYYLLTTASYFDLKKKKGEGIYHVFVLGLLGGLTDRYIIRSNRESGDGRYDIMGYRRDGTGRGFVIEFKTTEKEKHIGKEAAKALKQVKTNRYVTELREHGIEDILLIGIGFSMKHVEVLAEEG